MSAGAKSGSPDVSGDAVSGEIVSAAPEVSGDAASGEIVSAAPDGSADAMSGEIVSGEISSVPVSGEISFVPVSGEISSAPVSGEISSAPVSGEPHAPDEASILPATLGDDALREAVGVKARRAPRAADGGRGSRGRGGDDGDGDDGGDDPSGDGNAAAKPRSRRTMAVAAVSIIVGLSSAALVFLGRANAQRYLIVCTASRVSPEQGRGFPPWGSRPMTGAEWRPIALPTNAECKPRESESRDELGGWYLDLLIDRATTTLTARDLLDNVENAGAGRQTSPLDAAAAELDQALLLARNPTHRDQRKEIERLQGDVEYWRAQARVRDASGVLLDAAKQFETAATRRPRHVTDAAAWAAFVHELAGRLHAGPAASAPFPTPVTPPSGPGEGSSAAAPAGTELPVEPETGAGSNGSAAPAPVVVPSVPSGGVLL